MHVCGVCMCIWCMHVYVSCVSLCACVNERVTLYSFPEWRPEYELGFFQLISTLYTD